MCFVTFIYNMDTLRILAVLTVRIDLISLCTTVHAQYTWIQALWFFCHGHFEWNHREMNIAELILASLNVIMLVPWGFPNDIMGIPLMSWQYDYQFTAGGVENCHVLAPRGWFPTIFDIEIPKTPLYKGMVVRILT